MLTNNQAANAGRRKWVWAFSIGYLISLVGQYILGSQLNFEMVSTGATWDSAPPKPIETRPAIRPGALLHVAHEYYWPDSTQTNAQDVPTEQGWQPLLVIMLGTILVGVGATLTSRAFDEPPKYLKAWHRVGWMGSNAIVNGFIVMTVTAVTAVLNVSLISKHGYLFALLAASGGYTLSHFYVWLLRSIQRWRTSNWSTKPSRARPVRAMRLPEKCLVVPGLLLMFLISAVRRITQKKG